MFFSRLVLSCEWLTLLQASELQFRRFCFSFLTSWPDLNSAQSPFLSQNLKTQDVYNFFLFYRTLSQNSYHEILQN